MEDSCPSSGWIECKLATVVMTTRAITYPLSFLCLCSWHLHMGPVLWIYLSSFFEIGRNWGSEGSNEFPGVTKSMQNRVRIWPEAHRAQSCALSHDTAVLDESQVLRRDLRVGT